jgi:hypothetical protein
MFVALDFLFAVAAAQMAERRCEAAQAQPEVRDYPVRRP